MHFCDDTDRDREQSEDVDGCTAHEVIEVDGGHEVSLGITAADCLCIWFATQTGAAEQSWPQFRGRLLTIKMDQPREKFLMYNVLQHTR